MVDLDTGPPLCLVLEFARAKDGGDPFAFEFKTQSYTLRTPGGGREESSFPWTPELLADLGALRHHLSDPAIRSRVGHTLRRFLQPLGFAEIESRILTETQAGRAVHLTIRSAAAELYTLPWELLILKSTNRYVGELPTLLLRYEWPSDRGSVPEPQARPEGGRILFAWSAANRSVPASDTETAIAASCAQGSVPFSLQEDVLPSASLESLNQTLARAVQAGRPFSILHLLAHGIPIGTTFGVTLNGDKEGAVPVDAARLRQILAPYATHLRLIVLAVCDGGNSGDLANQLGSLAQNLHQAGIAAVVASRYPLSMPGAVELTRSLYHALAVTPTSLENALLAARGRLAEDASKSDWASVMYYAREEDGDDTRPIVLRPYRGLLAFQPHHQRFFFGRKEETEEILSDLAALRTNGRPRFLFVAGASGTGKSSVVLAGAVPRLLKTREWQLALMRPGRTPGDALDQVLADAKKRRRPGQRLLLIVDQFEEVFTQADDAAIRQAFVHKLWKLASDPDDDVSVIVTLRVDFIGQCGELAVLAQGVKTSLDRLAYDEAHRVFIAKLTPAQLERIITEPARLVGLQLQPGLVKTLLDDTAEEPGALPLLEYALDLLWTQRAGRELTHDAYKSIGGVEGALARTADQLIATLSADERRQAERLLVAMAGVQLTGGLDTRRSVSLDKERPRAEEERICFDRVVEVLVKSRLVVKGVDGKRGEGSEVLLEVAHEALLRKWPLLRSWVVRDWALIEQRRELETNAENWQKNSNERDLGAPYLLSGGRLRAAEALAQKSFLSDRALRFIEMSQTAAALRRQAPLDDLAQQGWGVVAPQGPRGDVLLELIRPLIERRECQMDRPARIYRVPPNMSASDTLRWRQSVYLDEQVLPGDRPMYLLLLGDLDELSCEMQQELAGVLLTGRLAFRRDEDYAAYARKAVLAEGTSAARLSPRLLLQTLRMGTSATEFGYERLITPLLASARSAVEQGKFPQVNLVELTAESFEVDALKAEAAAASVMLSISHGQSGSRKGWRDRDTQRQKQGSLLLGPSSWLTAAHLDQSRFLPGGVWIIYASYSAATASSDPYGSILREMQVAGHPSSNIPPNRDSFVAALPQTAMASPEGPLVVIGLADVGFFYAFSSPEEEEGEQGRLQRFFELLRLICRGSRVGSALGRLHQDVPVLTNEALALYELELRLRADTDKADTVAAPGAVKADDVAARRRHIQMERHTLRGLILLGDPAARLSM